MRFVVALAMLVMTTPSYAQEAAPLPAAPFALGQLPSGPLPPGQLPPGQLPPGQLPPGKPAGVSEAATSNHDLFIYISLGMVALTAAGLALRFSHRASVAATPTTQ
jgi:hypothetical protein